MYERVMTGKNHNGEIAKKKQGGADGGQL